METETLSTVIIIPHQVYRKPISLERTRLGQFLGKESSGRSLPGIATSGKKNQGKIVPGCRMID
jgi:hypothetical protein